MRQSPGRGGTGLLVDDVMNLAKKRLDSEKGNDDDADYWVIVVYLLISVERNDPIKGG